VLILLTNDDGIYAPGLAAMERELRRLGEVSVIAPATEQSGVGHAITYLMPLIVKEVYKGDQRWGWAVEGSPADCVKIGITEFCPRKPDLVVSGINSGLNAGINVLYSGTVAAAIEGAFFGITSVAVSLEYDEHAPFEQAAALARAIIEEVLARREREAELFNLNIPVAALRTRPRVAVVPMNVTPYGDSFEKRIDPWGREYFWMTGSPPLRQSGEQTDLSALAAGMVALTPLHYDMTHRAALGRMQRWDFTLQQPAAQPDSPEQDNSTPVVRPGRKFRQIVPPETET